MKHVNPAKHAKELVKVLGYEGALDIAITQLTRARNEGQPSHVMIWREILLQVLAHK